MRQSLAGLLWESLKSSYSAIIGVSGLIFSVALWLLVPETQVSFRIIVPLGALCLVLLLAAVVISLNAAYEANRTANVERQRHETLLAEYNDLKARGGAGLPETIEGKDPNMGTQAALICVLQPSQLFYQDHMVSFYSIGRQGFEALVGIGFVSHVQRDRKIQVTMTLVEAGQEEFAGRLRQNEGEAVRTTLVVPGVPRRYTSL